MSPSPVRPRAATAPAPLALVLAALVLTAVAGCGDDPGEGATAPARETITQPEDTTTSASTTTTTATTAPGPAADPPAPLTVPPGVAPVRVVVAGDSVGYTLGKDLPATLPGVAALTNRALIGCGLLTTGDRPIHVVDDQGFPTTYEGCGEPIANADAAALADDPDVILLVTGAWERTDHARDGRTVGPGDAGWTGIIRDALRARVQGLSAGGAPVGLWVDPCGPDEDARRRQEWYRDEVIAPVAAELAGAGTFVVDPREVVCAEGAPRDVEGVGRPRDEDGQHWMVPGATWLWTTWLGPTLATAVA